MAQKNKIRLENRSGDFFVDETCINCGTCYWISPETFQNINGKSAVTKQPTNEIEIKNTLHSILSCPTNSIGTHKSKTKLKAVTDDFPRLVQDNVYHCGFHSEKSFGATSYFIHDQDHNYLIDSPQYRSSLARKFESFGGIDFQLITHKDDIADTNKYHQQFNSKRLIHIGDVGKKTNDYEIILEGTDDFEIAKDLIVIPVPGHTKGSVVFLYQEKYLFTGDHLAFSTRLNHLHGFKNHCWHSLDLLIDSMEKLLNYNFTWVLPAHGSPYYGTKQEVQKSLYQCIEYLKS